MNFEKIDNELIVALDTEYLKVIDDLCEKYYQYMEEYIPVGCEGPNEEDVFYKKRKHVNCIQMLWKEEFKKRKLDN